MTIRTTCEQCGAKFRVKDQFAGRKTRCGKCGEPLVIPTSQPCPNCSGPVAVGESQCTACGCTPQQFQPTTDVRISTNKNPAPPTFAPGPNPYASPAAESVVIDTVPASQLATRSERFLGAVIDDLLLLPLTSVVVFVLLPNVSFRANSPVAELMTSVLAFVGGMGSVLVFHGYFLATRGQTIGKIVMKTRIVSDHGHLVPFEQLILKRYLPVHAIGCLPLIGGVFHLANALAIFGADRKCLHDQFAGTKVITLRGDAGPHAKRDQKLREQTTALGAVWMILGAVAIGIIVYSEFISWTMWPYYGDNTQIGVTGIIALLAMSIGIATFLKQLWAVYAGLVLSYLLAVVSLVTLHVWGLIPLAFMIFQSHRVIKWARQSS